MNQSRMMVNPLEEIMRNMHHRAMVEDIDMEIPQNYLPDGFEEGTREFYTCRTS